MARGQPVCGRGHPASPVRLPRRRASPLRRQPAAEAARNHAAPGGEPLRPIGSPLLNDSPPTIPTDRRSPACLRSSRLRPIQLQVHPGLPTLEIENMFMPHALPSRLVCRDPRVLVAIGAAFACLLTAAPLSAARAELKDLSINGGVQDGKA